MHIRAIITLAIALIMGGITVFLINHYLQQEVSYRAASKVIDTTPVVVAAANIKSGTRLDKVHLKIVDWPAKAAPENSFASVEAILGDKPPILLSEVHSGEPILPYKLSKQGARGGLPARIPENWRAITISVSEVTGVAGFVTPGDYVDVLHTTVLGQPDKLPVTSVLLQNVQVLGIDQVSSPEDSDPKVVNAVTLLVSLYDTQRLTLAQETGNLNLVLRNEFDASILEGGIVSSKELMKIEAQPEEKEVKVFKRATRKPAAAAPTHSNVEVIRGVEVTTQKVNKEKDAKQQPAPAATTP